MFENVISFFKRIGKKEALEDKSKNTAKERLQLVLMQDRANVSADFLDMMRQEIIEVIKKYIDVDESQIDVKLTNKTNEDGTVGAPALYANIPIAGIKENVRKQEVPKENKEDKQKLEEKVEVNSEKTEAVENEEESKSLENNESDKDDNKANKKKKETKKGKEVTEETEATESTEATVVDDEKAKDKKAKDKKTVEEKKSEQEDKKEEPKEE